MQNVIIIIPKQWNVKRVRYMEAVTDQLPTEIYQWIHPVLFVDADKIPTPLEDSESLYNYPLYNAKKYRRENH